MKKGVYIVTKNLEQDKITDPGVFKKIMAQMGVFNKNCKIELIEAYYKTSTLRKALSRLPFFPNLFYLEWKKYDWSIDFIYFRLNLGDSQIIKFFKYVKSVNPNCKIIVELPDYPVQWENFFRKWHQKLFIKKHENCERKLKQYVDKIVVFNPYDQIYGIPTIVTQNGVDTDAVKLRKIGEYTDVIHIMSVSTMLYWQGIDRLIVALGEYYKNIANPRQIKLHLVGSGQCLEEYKALCLRYNLDDVVIFHGYQNGHDLDEIYDQCNIALAEIGRFRVQKEQKRSTSIKVREYWAKGLPIICASTLDEKTIEQIGDYIMVIPNDETPVDIENMIKFYDSVYQDGQEAVANSIREYAEMFCSVDTVMKPIIEYINS